MVDHSKKRAIIIDVACPFESSSDAFRKARDSKRTKYDGIKTNLESKGYTVVLDALIVGSLGAWDPLNAAVLSALNILGKKRAAVARKCVQTAIRGSYLIWKKRCLAESGVLS